MLLALFALQVAAQPPLMIFFDSGKAELRREWEPVLDAAVTRAKAGERLLVVGHSDRPGSTQSNRRLARERAAVVVKALVDRGVPAQSLEQRSSGEERSLVPTADGVREIQNRRVEILVQH